MNTESKELFGEGVDLLSGALEVSHADTFLPTLSVVKGPQLLLDVSSKESVSEGGDGDVSGGSHLLHLLHEVSELLEVEDAISVGVSSLEGGSHLSHELTLGLLGSPLGSVGLKLALVLGTEASHPCLSPCCDFHEVLCHLSFLLS